MFDNLDLALQIQRKFTREEHEQRASDTYRTEAKRFLEAMDIRLVNVKSSTYQIINNVFTDITLPAKGEQLRIRMQQQINLIAILLKIVDVHNTIDELTIATYTLNKEAFGVLQDLIRSNRIKICNLFLASSYTFRSPSEYEEFKRVCLLLSNQGFQVHLAFAWLHLKITLARCGSNYYQFEGSMNYSTNNMAEQLVFENSQDTYTHDLKFLQKTVLEKGQAAIEIIC